MPVGSQRLWVHHYRLWPKQALNARSSSLEPKRGALIHVGSGYACLHPWPELGQAPLEQHLASIVAGEPTELAAQALRCCEIDGAAREAGVSCFSGLTPPESHATLVGIPTQETLWQLHEAGFRCGKLKVDGRQPPGPFLEKLLPLLAWQDWTYRLDFNATLAPEAAEAWFSALTPYAARIDFLEDPLPYQQATWEGLSADFPFLLAVDWHDGPPSNVPNAAAQVRVWKPGCQAIQPCPQERELVTSLMDHPLGQAYAALIASQLPSPLHCGLLTQHVYAENDFSAVLGQMTTPYFPVPQGHGLGFDDLLRGVEWE
jgi:o-succinylbenzoate synthase